MSSRVLIVASDPEERNEMEQILRRSGYETCQADTLAEAVEKLDGQEVVILDLMLPDGGEVLRRLRGGGMLARVAVLPGFTFAEAIN